MRRCLILVLLVTSIALPAHADPPSNDTPATATVVSTFPATIEADTREATTGENETDCGDTAYVTALPARAVWYRLDLPEGAHRLSIRHDETNAYVRVWGTDGSGQETLHPIDCVYAYQEREIPADYDPKYISVGAPLLEDPPPVVLQLDVRYLSNEYPSEGTLIPSLPYEVTQDTQRAEHDAFPDDCSYGGYVWYGYVPDDGLIVDIVVDPDPSDAGATLVVHSADVGTLACLASIEGSISAQVSFAEGDEILIGIGRRGSLTLSIDVAGFLPAPNDHRADRVSLGFGDGDTYRTTGATLEPGEPTSCGDGGSVWYLVPPGARASVVTVSAGASIASVADDEVTACSTTGSLTLEAGHEPTLLQVRAPDGTVGEIGVGFTPPFGTQLTDASPLPEACGDRSDTPQIDSEVEVHLAVDPHDPDHLLASWQQDRYDDHGGARGIGAAVSFDGGETWTTSVLPSTSLCTGGPFMRATDPWGAIDADGTAYVMSLGYNPGPAQPLFLTNTVLLHRSEDGGRTWNEPIVVAASPAILFNDKETLTADPNTPGLLYAVWNLYPTSIAFPVFSRSEDGGRTWTPPVPLPFGGGGVGDQIAVLDDGTLVAVANREGIRSITSRDRGQTWSQPTVISSNGGWFEGPPNVRGGASIPSVATDGASVFVSWSDTFFTFVARSDDAGATWRVSETAGFSGQDRFTTAVAVTDGGRVVVMTYKLYGFAASVVMAVSDDGGVTWIERAVTDRFQMARAPYSRGRGYFLGDYFGLQDVGDEVFAAFAAVPPGTERGVSNVYTLRVAP